MIELFEAVERCELGSVNIAVTALEPEYLGEKALISNGQIVWKSSAKSFFDGREEAVSQLQESGIETVDGCKVFCDTLGQEKASGSLRRRTCVDTCDQDRDHDGNESNCVGRPTEIR